MTIYGLQYDSTAALPIPGAIQAYYLNGRFAHRPVTYGRGKVWVDVLASDPLSAHWLDIETGDAAPADFPRWNMQRHLGCQVWGGFYCNRDTLPKVLEILPETMHADLWLATLDGTADPRDIPEVHSLPAHVTLVAIQAFPETMAGFHADVSVVVDRAYWDSRHV